MAIRIKIAAEYDQKGLKTAQKELADFGDKAKKAFAAVGVAALAVGVGLAKFGADSIAAAENVAQADNRLQQVAKSMNLFGAETEKVAQRLIDFAEKNELLVGVDGEVIKATQAKLLTFKELAKTADEMGGEFDRATMAALDLAAAGFGSAESNATQLGKALQDPIKGLTALTRSGITFTAEEKNKIKTLTESGQVLSAQQMILSAIEKQVGGTAQATAKASDRMKLAFENINEAVGKALLPTFNMFAEEVIKLTPELERALAPAAEEVAEIFRTQVLPAIQNFTKWLASPQGTQTLKELAQAVVDSIRNFIDFSGWVIQNRVLLGNLALAIGSVVVVYKTLTTVIGLARAAQIVFNAAAWSNPYILVAAAIVAAVAAIAIGFDALSKANKGTTAATKESSGELARFNNLKLNGIQGQINGVAGAANNARAALTQMYSVPIGPGLDPETGRSLFSAPTAKDFPLNPRPGQVYTWFKYEMVNGQQLAVWYEQTWSGTKWSSAKKVTNVSGGGGGSGESAQAKALRERQEAFKKVQSLIKSAQKDIAAAQEEYNQTIRDLETDNAKEVSRIQTEFSNRLADIAKQSRARLTDAFRNAATVSLSDLFEVDDRRSVGNLVSGLTEKLKGARNLITNAAALTAAGFSQTFVEQIVSAGTTTGNEMAAAILASTPETQAELRSLFAQIEDTANNGMDSLAEQIYNSQGLATQELRDLYVTTQIELGEALLEQQTKFGKSLEDARNKLVKSLETIREKLREDLAEMDGYFAGLGKTVDAFMDKLDELIEKYKAMTLQTNLLGEEATGVDAAPVSSIIDTTSLERIRTLIKNAETWLTKNLDVFERIRAEDVLEIYRGLEQDILNAVRIDLSGIRSGMSVEDLVLAAKAAGGQSINNFYLEVYADSRASGAVAGQEVVEKLEAFTRANGAGGGGLLWKVQ
jgi:DNA-directed RNA polymerase subunit F